IPREDFTSLMYNNMSVMKAFVKMLTDNVQEKERQLLNLAYSTVRKRVAEALVLLHSRYAEEKDGDFTIAITRSDLANIVGTATESLIRTLSDFKEEGMVEMKGTNITITNLGKLKTLKA